MTRLKAGKGLNAARSTLSIQKDVIFALTLREMNQRFADYTLGTVWIILEPLLMIMAYIAIFGLRGRGEFSYVEPPVFIMVGFLPFRMMWQGVMRDNMNALGAAKGLTGFRQLRLFDVFLTRSLVNGGVYLVVATLLSLGFLWLGFDIIPADPLGVLCYSGLFWLFCVAAGILVCVISDFAREVERVVQVLMMPAMFVSAVFYPATVVPPQFHFVLIYNPIAHAIELIRQSWFANYESPVASVQFLTVVTIVFWVIAMAAYRLRWRRMVMS